jgi:hypothetical protein
MLKRIDFENKPGYSISIVTILITGFLSIIGWIFIKNKFITVSFLIGVVASLIGFLLNVYRTDIVLQEDASHPVLKAIIGYTINYLIYGLALFVSIYFSILNLYATLAGLFVIKIIIYIKYGYLDLRIQKKLEKRKEGDKIE